MQAARVGRVIDGSQGEGEAMLWKGAWEVRGHISSPEVEFRIGFRGNLNREASMGSRTEGVGRWS